MFAKFFSNAVVPLVIILSVAFILWALNHPDGFVNNVGFLLIGAVLAVLTTLVVEWRKRESRSKELTRVLHAELSDLVGRCCFDVESPWSDIRKNGTHLIKFNPVWLQKFLPAIPAVYPTVTSELAMLGNGAPLALIHFHYRLAALRREIQNIVKDVPPMTQLSMPHLKTVSERLHQTLPFGLHALEQLSANITDAAHVEDAAIKFYDETRSGSKPNGSLRARIRALI